MEYAKEGLGYWFESSTQGHKILFECFIGSVIIMEIERDDGENIMKVSITNIKTRNQVILEHTLESIRNGEIRLKVNNQHDEYVIEDALKNFDKFEEVAEEWHSQGGCIENVDPMTWAYQLSGFYDK